MQFLRCYKQTLVERQRFGSNWNGIAFARFRPFCFHSIFVAVFLHHSLTQSALIDVLGAILLTFFAVIGSQHSSNDPHHSSQQIVEYLGIVCGSCLVFCLASLWLLNTGVLFVYLHTFSNRIQTRIIEEGGRHADHKTTSTDGPNTWLGKDISGWRAYLKWFKLFQYEEMHILSPSCQHNHIICDSIFRTVVAERVLLEPVLSSRQLEWDTGRNKLHKINIFYRRTQIDRISDWPNGFWSTWTYLFKHTKRTPLVKPRRFGQSKIRSIRCLPYLSGTSNVITYELLSYHYRRCRRRRRGGEVHWLPSSSIYWMEICNTSTYVDNKNANKRV